MASKNTIEIIISAVDDSKKALDGVGGGLDKLGKVAAIAGAAAVAAVTSIGVGIAKLAIDAAPIAGVQAAFEGMAESAGVSSDKMLAALKDASAGMISQTDLMMSFNKAAQLVGEDFAVQLPDAMQYLSKVAAATGEDMDYMLNSLVVGVGRLSPMILDNLGIQVNLTEATETYAESIGKSVSELSKSEQQTALMNQVLEKLRTNTAAMPDVTGSAAAGIASFGTIIKDAKDAVGLAFVPALQALMVPMNEIATGVGQQLVEWAQVAGKWLGEELPKAIDVIKNLLSGDFEDALWGVATIISETFGRDAAIDFINFAEKVQEAIEKIQGFVDTVGIIVDMFMAGFGAGGMEGALGYLGDFPWEDIFPESVANQIYSVLDVLENVFSWVQTNWPKIQATVLKAVEEIKKWFDQNWPLIQSVVLTAWEVIQDVIGAVIENVVPAVQEFVATIGEHLESFGPAIEALKDLWESLAPVLEVVLAVVGALILAAISVIVANFEGLLAALGPIIDGIAGVIAGIATALSGILDFAMAWRDLLVALFTGTGDDVAVAWEKMKDAVVKIATGLWSAIDSLFTGAMAAITEYVMGFIEGIIGFFTELWENLVGESIIPEMLESIYDWFESILADITTRIMTFVSDVINWFIQLKDDAIAKISEMMTTIFTTIETALKDLIQLFSDKFEEIKTAIGDKITEIIDGINGFVQDFFDAGWAIMDSLRQGIMGMADQIWQDIMGWLNALIQDIWNKIKNQAEEQAYMVGQAVTGGMSLGVAATAHVAPIEGGTYNYYFNQTINTRAGASAMRHGFEEIRALVGAR